MVSRLILLVLSVLCCVIAASPNGRIVGGAEAKLGQFPYLVSLRRGSAHVCGGSILDETTILCAAHCVYGALVPFHKIVAGTISIKDGGDSYQISKFIPHKEYNKTTMVNDIAIIKLKEPIWLKKNVHPVKLPTKNTLEHEDCTLAGWGSTSFPGISPTKLQYIPLRTIGNVECNKKQTTMGVDEKQLCTLTKTDEGVCHGDSGGPLVNTNREQIGVVSWGTPCAKGEPDIFTRVHSYLDWIEEHRK